MSPMKIAMLRHLSLAILCALDVEGSIGKESDDRCMVVTSAEVVL